MIDNWSNKRAAISGIGKHRDIIRLICGRRKRKYEIITLLMMDVKENKDGMNEIIAISSETRLEVNIPSNHNWS